MAEVSSSEIPNIPERRFKFRQAVLTDVGLKRDENQDSYGFAHTNRVSIFIVADGMGGARGGATASALAVDTVLRASFDEYGSIREKSLREAVEYANEVIHEKSQSDETLSGMGTTLVVLAFIGNQALIGHVGDSRIYAIKSGQFLQLTRDHTLVQELVDSGAISSSEAENHPIAHMLTRSLGPAGMVEACVVPLPMPIEKGDKFLLCSDGLYNLVAAEELQQILHNYEPQTAAKMFLDLALERGGIDNISIEIIEVFDLNDQNIDAPIPEEGKIRVVVSSTVDPAELNPPPPLIPTNQTKHIIPSQDDPISSANPLDAIIFEENPSKEDLEKDRSTKKRVEEVDKDPVDESSSGKETSSENKQLEANAVPSADSTTEDTALPEPSEDDIKSINRLLYLAGGILVVVFFVFIAIYYLRNADQNTPTGEIIKLELHESVPLSGEPAIEPTAQPISSPTTAVPTKVEKTTTVAPVVADKPEESWPQLNIIPGKQPVIRNVDKPFPSSIAIVESKQREPFALPKAIAAEVLSLKVEETSSISATVSPKERPVEPIDWSKEKEVIKGQQTIAAEPTKQLKKRTPPNNETELKALITEKNLFRERIKDYEIKLKLLDSKNETVIQNLSKELQNNITLATESYNRAKSRLELVRIEYLRWLTRQQEIGEKDPLRLVEEITSIDPEVKQGRREYEDLIKSYDQAMLDWKNNSQNSTLVPKVALLGRQVKEKRAQFEGIVRNAVQRGITESTAEILHLHVNLNRLTTYINRLNRESGYLKALLPNTDGRNESIKADMLKERAQDYAEYASILEVVSDQQEEEQELKIIKLQFAK